MTRKNILIADDEVDICNAIKFKLEQYNYNIKTIYDGEEALKYIQKVCTSNPKEIPILFILDWMLPHSSGIEICKFLRACEKTKKSSILMVTAKSEPEHIIKGIDCGADDYITKPFDINILDARVRSLIKRANYIIGEEKNNEDSNILKFSGIKINTEQYKVWSNDKDINTTPSEFKILVTFLKNPGKTFTRNQLIKEIQGGGVHVIERVIDTHVVSLRKKLSANGSIIETIRGIGYRIKDK